MTVILSFLNSQENFLENQQAVEKLKIELLSMAVQYIGKTNPRHHDYVLLF